MFDYFFFFHGGAPFSRRYWVRDWFSFGFQISARYLPKLSDLWVWMVRGYSSLGLFSIACLIQLCVRALKWSPWGRCSFWSSGVFTPRSLIRCRVVNRYPTSTIRSMVSPSYTPRSYLDCGSGFACLT